MIAEVSGSIFDHANGRDTDDNLSSRAELIPHQSTQSTTPRNEAKDDDIDENDDLIRDGPYFPTIMPPFKSRKQDGDAASNKRKRSSSLLKRLSAHILKLTSTKVAGDERGHLNRDFQFPSRDGSLQRVVSVPALDDDRGDDRVQQDKHRRHVSLGGVLKVSRGKGYGQKQEEYVVEDLLPRKSFLWRQVEWVNDFLVRRNW
jgi:hypothetical protein